MFNTKIEISPEFVAALNKQQATLALGGILAVVGLGTVTLMKAVVESELNALEDLDVGPELDAFVDIG